jgi:fluoride ion exporter CrcB/FEX
MQRFLYEMFNGPIWRAFLLMGLFGGLSAITSFNLAVLFVANFPSPHNTAPWL